MIPIADQGRTRQRFPIINLTLIAVNAAVFFYEISLGDAHLQAFYYRFGLIPRELTEGVSYTALVTPLGTMDIESPMHTWGTVFTSMFIHGGLLHFLGNMVFLWVFGDNVEDRLGPPRYLLLYLAAGVAAGWTQVAINSHSEVPTIGASGAIAGVLGAYALLYPFNRVRTLVIFVFITFVDVPAVYLLGFWIVLQFFSGLGALDPAVSTGGVAYWAHVGGFVAGIMGVSLLKLLVWRERLLPRRPMALGP